MTTIWSRISLLICPLAWGAGSRLKLLEAAAWGVPIIATPMSTEGLSFKPGHDYLIAQSPEELAEAALGLLSDPLRAKSLAYQARQTVMAHHDWTELAPTLARIYADLGDAESTVNLESKP
jgi:glycosyltransferase involved in cell wall biosynthesis